MGLMGDANGKGHACGILDDTRRYESLHVVGPWTWRLIGSMTDVVKTRLQVEARKGQTHYKGLTDAFVKICELLRRAFMHLIVA